jgi:hypothetical protein
MIMFGSFLPSRLVGFGTTKVYSGLGADIVMESISLIEGVLSVIEIFRHLPEAGRSLPHDKF